MVGSPGLFCYASVSFTASLSSITETLNLNSQLCIPFLIFNPWDSWPNPDPHCLDLTPQAEYNIGSLKCPVGRGKWDIPKGARGLEIWMQESGPSLPFQSCLLHVMSHVPYAAISHGTEPLLLEQTT